MKNIFLSILFSFVFTGVFSQNVQSEWMDSPLKIDGKSTDWKEEPGMYDAATGMLFDMANDSKNLYLIFELPDKKTQANFMRAGFQLEISVKTKPKLKASIHFPLMERIDDGQGMIQTSGQQRDRHQDYLAIADYAEIEGFILSEDVIQRDEHTDEAFTYNISWDEKEKMILEVQIPLLEIYQDYYLFEDMLSIDPKVKAKLNAMERPSGEGMQQGRGGMPPGGGGSGTGNSGGGRPSGGRGQGGKGQGGGMHPQGNAQDRQAMFSEQSFSFKVQLSNK